VSGSVPWFVLDIVLKDGEAKADVVTEPEPTLETRLAVYPGFFKGEAAGEPTGYVGFDNNVDTIDCIGESDVTY